jgi:hypothetical protein
VVWCFPSCQNCSVKRTHWAHPAYLLISALRRRALAGRRNAADRRNPLLLWHITVGYTESSCGQALILSRRWAANARGERNGCKAKQNRRGKTALTCGTYSHSSTVLEWRREWENNSLVTITVRRFQFRGAVSASQSGLTGRHRQASAGTRRGRRRWEWSRRRRNHCPVG